MFTQEKTYLANKGSDSEIVTVWKAVNEGGFCQEICLQIGFSFFFLMERKRPIWLYLLPSLKQHKFTMLKSWNSHICPQAVAQA